MAKALTVSVRGLKELNAKIRQMDSAVSAQSIRGLLVYGANMIRERALQILRSHTQRSSKNREGWEHLEDAFIVQEGKSQTYMKAWTKIRRQMAPQGIWLEFGHRIVGHKPRKKDTGKQTVAKPFLKPAVDETGARVRQFISLGVRRMMEGGTLERSIKITKSGNISRRK